MSDSSKKHPLLSCSKYGARDAHAFSVTFIQAPYRTDNGDNHKENMMGKYFLAWLLGVPGVVLLLIYFFMR